MAYGGMELNPLQVGYAPGLSYGLPELAPQGAFGNFFSGMAPTLGGMIGGAFGQRQLGTSIGQGAAPLLRLLPFQSDPLTAAYASGQLAPAGWFGNLISSVAPIAGRAVGGPAGQAISTIGGLGRYLPFDVDPVTAAYGSGQLAPAGWFGNLISNFAPVAGRAVGGPAGQAISTIGGLGRYLPFDVNPVTAMYGGGQQLAPAGWFGNLISNLAPIAARTIGGTAGQTISTIGGLGRYLPFDVDPLTAAYASGQLPSAGWLNLIRPHVPISSDWPYSIGGQRLDGGIGPIGLGGQRPLPFSVDPMTAAYAAGQLAPQGVIGNFLGGISPALGGMLGGAFGQRQLGSAIGQGASPLLRLLPFQTDPMTAAYAGAQLAPQGAFGNFFGGIAPTLGGMLGGAFGQRQLGSAIGQGAAPFLRMLPFDVDPLTAAYAGQLGPQGLLGQQIAPMGLPGQQMFPQGLVAQQLAQQAALAQLAPQGFFGGILGGLAGGLGGRAIGNLFGGSGGDIGNQIGSALGGIAGGILPFQVDPLTAAYGSGLMAAA